MLKRILLISVAAAVLIAPDAFARNKQGDIPPSVTPIWYTKASASIKPLLDKGVAIKGLSSAQRQEVVAFYKARNYQPVWLAANGWSARMANAVYALNRSHHEGLLPEHYTSVINQVNGPKATIDELVRAEVALTSAVLDYIDDVFGERLNPKRIKRTLYLSPKQTDAPAVLSEGLANDPTAQFLSSLTINNPEYQALKGLLNRYIDAKESGQWPTITQEKGKKRILPIKTLLQLLTIHGDYTGPIKDKMNDEAVEALRTYQKRHKLKITGTVTPGTYTSITRSPDDRIKQISVTMERWRWRPEDMGQRYINVNIASFSLRAYDQGKLALKSRVIIGKNARQTPVVTTYTDQVRFNPSWGVPAGIFAKDKLPKLRRNPNSMRGFSVYNSKGQRVSVNSVDWNNVSAGSGYRLVQPPGANNALGKIRFSLHTPFSIFLHSTPSKHLFDREVRSFSSGCIRVAKPAELAEYLFNDHEKWPIDRIRKKMKGTQTENISIPKVPVHVTYHTVYKGDDGLFYFANDVYSQDQLVWNALKKA